MQIKLKQSFQAPLLILIIYILLAISNYINIGSLAQNNNIFLSVIIMQIIIFVIPGIIYCKFRGKTLTPALRLNLFGPSKLWLALSSFFVLISGSSIIKLGLYSIGYYSTKYTMYENYMPSSIHGFGNVLYIIIAIALMPAITEEFIFRGILFGEYTLMGCNKTVAILLSALLFSLVHFNMYQLPVYFFGGIVFAFVALTTNSLLCAIIVHFLNNCFSLFFETQLLNLITQTDSVIFVLFILMIVFLSFLALTLQTTERSYYLKGIRGEISPDSKKKKKKKSKERYNINLEALISPTFVLCIVAFIIITFAFK